MTALTIALWSLVAVIGIGVALWSAGERIERARAEITPRDES